MTKVELYKVKMFVTSIHLIAFVQYAYGIYYDHVHLKVPEDLKLPMISADAIGGKARFLTYWCLILQAVYFTISLLNDLIGSNDISPKKLPLIRRVKDYLLAALAFPVAMNVGISFWSLMAIDRELVFPKVFDAFFPGWLNHVMHTNIMVFIMLEMFISFRAYPKRSKGLTGLGIFMVSYLVWIHVIKHYSGIWVYPVLDVLNFPQRLAFFILVLSITFVLYMVGEFLNSIIWAKELKQISRKAH